MLITSCHELVEVQIVGITFRLCVIHVIAVKQLTRMDLGLRG